MSSFEQWRQSIETNHGKYVHEYNTFEVAKDAHTAGRESMRQEAIAIIKSAMVADPSLDKIVRALEELE